MFHLPFERVAGGILQIDNFLTSLVKQQNTSWLRVNRQRARCSHKNVILSVKVKPRSCHLRFDIVLPVIIDSHAATLPGLRRRPRTVPRT